METVRPLPDAAWVHFARRGACAARFGVEFDGVAGDEGLYFASRAGDRVGTEVDLEVALGEQAGAVGALAPRLGEHGAARVEDVVDDGAVYVGAIDMQLDESKPLALDVLCDGHGAQLLGAIGGRHGAGDDRREVQVARDVLLVAVEALRAALASVTYLAVADRDAAVRCDALADASPAVRGAFQVLRAHLPEGFDVRSQRLGHDVVEVTVYPALERGDLALDDLHGHRLLFRVAPVDVESGLDARCE